MKVTQLAGSSCWASRMNEKTKVFKRIEIHSPKDVSKLTVNDNFFVSGDDVANDIADALTCLCDDNGWNLIPSKTSATSVVRFWIAPPMKS